MENSLGGLRYRMTSLWEQDAGSGLKHASILDKEAVLVGKDISIDEQTLGFQGKHADKKRHNEKKEGGGVQCESLNTEHKSLLLKKLPLPH